MNEKKKILLSFDLDFTLVNNQEGIIASFNYALDKFKISHLKESEILKMIGLPLADMFKKITDLEPDGLIYAFREYYRAKGIYQVELLPGVRKKLQELKDNSFLLGIITSKKQELAAKVVEILGISRFFEYIIGDGKIMKTKLDSSLKHYLQNNYPDHQFIIIGDHPKDRAFAEHLEVPFIGVLTGIHSAEELKNSNKIEIRILNSVAELDPNIIISLIQNDYK